MYTMHSEIPVKRGKYMKKRVVIGSFILSLSIVTLSLMFPAYSGTAHFDIYTDYSSEIDMTEDSKGIKITINDAIFDGQTAAFSVSIQSNQELGDPIIADKLWVNGKSKSLEMSRIDKNNYIFKVTNFNQIEEDSVNIKWSIESFFIQVTEVPETIKGDWEFAFTLKATDSKVKIVNNYSEQNGVKLNVEKLSEMPDSFLIYYDLSYSDEVITKWNQIYVDFKMKDDLEHIYNLGVDNPDKVLKNNIGYGRNIEKINEKATKLIITPYITLLNKNVESSQTQSNTRRGILLEDIIIDLSDY
ncbi:DUF4179 domain-containing protein [Chengkuizengella marina]